MRPFAQSLAFLASAALAAACSSPSTSTGSGATADATGKSDAKASDAAGSDDAALTDGADDDGALTDAKNPDAPDLSGFFDDDVPDAADTGVAFNPDAACNAIAAQGKPSPVSLLFVLDYSWSMCMDPSAPLSQLNCATDPAKAKWSILVEAMKAAVPSLPEDSYSGMVYYPDVMDSNTVCKVAAAPHVPLALTGPAGSPQRAQLISSLPALLTDNSPVASTPTGDALKAMYAYYAATPESDTPGASRYVVLITDGKPTCGSSPANSAANILAAVKGANGATSPVHTFVVGVPGSQGALTTLSQAAKAGGTAPANCSDTGPTYCHFDMTAYSSPADLATHLADALGAIKGQAIGCDYKIPPNPKGGSTNYAYVNVRYTPGNGGAPQDLVYDPACTGPGWHFDDAATPQHILICAASCTTIKADASAKMDVLFGCPRQEK